jgi:hypothetical protein
MLMIQFIMVPGDIASKTDISIGAKMMYGRVRIFNGEIISEYVANDLGIKLEDARKYLHELVRMKLVEESRLDRHTLFLFSSSINIYSTSSFYNRSNNHAKEEEKKEEFFPKEEKKKKEEYLQPEEAAAKLRELKERLKVKRMSAAGSGKMSREESRLRQKRAIMSIVEGG